MEKLAPKYIYLLTGLYFVLSLIGILNHELWLDESHHFLIARDSRSTLELINNTRYEGHPILWNYLLYLITRFSANPFWMQFLHIVISSFVVFIFLKKAPFNWLFKALFIFGYFMLFEYNLISRNYILGVLFLFLAATQFENRKLKFTLICFYLALACNIHLMFSVIAFALFLLLVFEKYQNKELHNKMFLGVFIFIIGVYIVCLQIIPPEDTLFFDDFANISLPERLTKGYISLFKGLITIPDFTSIHFWNSNLLVNISKPFSGILGLVCYLIPLLLFYKKPKVLFFVYIALIGTQIFFFITQRGATRFDGMTYIILILALWVEKYFLNENTKHSNLMTSFKINLLKKPIVYGILIIHFFSGIFAYALEIKYPFCTAKETVNYLSNNKIDTQNVISVTCDGTLISPFLEKKVYFLLDENLQSYCNWDFISATNISQVHIKEMISKYIQTHKKATYVSTYPIENKQQKDIWVVINDDIKVRFIEKFDISIVRNANYFIYEVSETKPRL